MSLGPLGSAQTTRSRCPWGGARRASADHEGSNPLAARQSQTEPDPHRR